MSRWLLALCLGLVALSCDVDVVVGRVHPLDGGVDPLDAGLPDAGLEGQADAGSDAGSAPDAGGVDAGALDAGEVDAGALDAGELDAGEVDAGALDAGELDAGPLDAGPVDSGVADSGVPDAGTPDAGAPDSGATWSLDVTLDAPLAVPLGTTSPFTATFTNDGGAPSPLLSAQFSFPPGAIWIPSQGCTDGGPSGAQCEVPPVGVQGSVTVTALAKASVVGWFPAFVKLGSQVASTHQAVTSAGAFDAGITAPRALTLLYCLGAGVTSFAQCPAGSEQMVQLTLQPGGRFDVATATDLTADAGRWGQTASGRDLAFRVEASDAGIEPNTGFVGQSVSETCFQGTVSTMGAWQGCLN